MCLILFSHKYLGREVGREIYSILTSFFPEYYGVWVIAATRRTEIVALNLGTIHETVFTVETIITAIATVFDNDALYLDSPSIQGK